MCRSQVKTKHPVKNGCATNSVTPCTGPEALHRIGRPSIHNGSLTLAPVGALFRHASSIATREASAHLPMDDYVSVGQPQQLKWLDEQLQKKYQIKTQILGPGGEHLKELKIYNRIVV